jgi:hypothetical protein
MQRLNGTDMGRPLHGPGIVKNANTKLIGQQPGDMSALESQLHLNDVSLAAIKRFSFPQKGLFSE